MGRPKPLRVSVSRMASTVEAISIWFNGKKHLYKFSFAIMASYICEMIHCIFYSFIINKTKHFKVDHL